MIETTKLAGLLVQLALGRRRLGALDADAMEAHDALRATEEYAEWERVTDAAKAQREANDKLETEIRELAVAAYVRTKDKAPVRGVGIRVSKRYIYDEPIALAWAQHRLPDAVKLDRRVFERVIPQLGVPEFVTVEEIASATISRDLNDLLD